MSSSNTSLKGKTVFITGASRGIGAAIAKRVAKEGANTVLVAKTTEAHPSLPGTIYAVAEEIKKEYGTKVLAIPTDIRYESQIEAAVKETVRVFGGIDILVNNASAIWVQPTSETPMKRFDLMNQINTRGTYACSYYCLPYLKKSAQLGRNPHILNLSPPLNLNPRWFRNHVAYTIAKYGMSMCVLGMSEEFKPDGIGVNALWPRTGIATAAIEWIAGKEAMQNCRKVEIMSDAAYYILSRKGSECTGNFFIDDEVLLSEGMTEKDLEQYAVNPNFPLMTDLFLDTMKPKL
jgi:citronellol/citronellal dehydrogenase